MAITTAIVQVAAPTSTGTQDITTTELGGLTPKAALFFMSGGVTDDAAVDHGRIAFGATDGTREWYMGARSEDGVGTTETTRGAHTTGLIGLIDTNLKAKDSEAAFVTFIANGIRIDWTNAPSVAHKLTVVFFAGTDLEVFADVVDPGLQDVGLNITAPGFEPDAIFTGFNNRAFDSGMDDGVGGHHEYGFGVSQNPGDSGIADGVGQSNNDRDGRASTEVTSSVANDRSAFHVKDGTYRRTIELSDFDASGFTATARDTDGQEFGYLALACPDTNITIGIYDTPTSTGNDSKTGVGFEPDTVLFGLSFFDGALTDPPAVTTDDFSYGISAFTATDESSVSIQTQDAVATSNTKSIADSIAANLPLDNGVAGFKASFVSMDSDGWTLNFSNTVGSSRKWWFIAIGKADAKGQVSQAEFEVPLEAGQVSQTELEVPNPDARGQISHTEFEIPLNSQGQVSFAEFEVPPPPTKGQLSFTEFQIPTQLVESRGNVSFGELEIPDFDGFSAGQFGFAQLEIPDVDNPDRPGQISEAELQIPNVNAGGTQGASTITFTELEIPDAKSIQITELHLETEDPRRRGRVSFARVEYASVAGQNRQVKIVLQNINRKLFLEELDVYGIKPDIGFFLPGFDPIDQELPEPPLEQSDVDPQRIWTPKLEISTQFGEPVQRGEMWLEYSFVLTEDDLFHILLVCNQHDSTKTTDGQDIEDQFFEDLAVLRDYSTRCGPTGNPQLTAEEKDDCHCRLLRVVLRLSTETTIRRIQEDPFTDEPFDLDLSALI